ncbi:MAG: purine-nucleoside phosphorylase [Bacteroidota bacterium]
MMSSHEDNVRSSVSFIRSQIPHAPKVGVILGSGLGDFADGLQEPVSISTNSIPHYPLSSVQGHRGRLVFGKIGPKDILAFQGRIHFYESDDLDVVLFPIHVAHALGIRTLIVTNAAGGINRTFSPGDLMVISDQINLTFESYHGQPASWNSTNTPLYAPELQQQAMQSGAELHIALKQGVYVGVKGPSYETAAEIGMLGRIGADAVGMSTVFETQLAVRLGMRVLGISCITNYATGISPEKLNHHEVTEVGNRVRTIFGNLLTSIVTRL